MGVVVISITDGTDPSGDTEQKENSRIVKIQKTGFKCRSSYVVIPKFLMTKYKLKTGQYVLVGEHGSEGIIIKTSLNSH